MRKNTFFVFGALALGLILASCNPDPSASVCPSPAVTYTVTFKAVLSAGTLTISDSTVTPSSPAAGKPADGSYSFSGS
jgi:hypothetical protein